MQAVGELVAGRELDALIAEKVMGWHLCPHAITDRARDAWWVLPDGTERETFEPSTDIAAAWQVVEHMKAAGMEVQILYPSATTFEWAVVFGDQFGAPFAKATTGPLAICRAALAAAGH